MAKGAPVVIIFAAFPILWTKTCDFRLLVDKEAPGECKKL